MRQGESTQPASPENAHELERLRAELAHFRALVETTSDWLWQVDAQGRYVYASPKVKELLGYEVAEVLGKTPFDFMDPAEARRVGSDFLAIAERQEPFHELLNVNRHKDGREVVLETSGVPVFDAQGLFVGYRGIDRDVTEREHAMHRLRVADTAMQSGAEGVIVADAHGRVTACNPAFSSMSGYDEAGLTGRPPELLVPSASGGRESLWERLDGVASWSGEGTCHHRTGAVFPVWLTLSQVRHHEAVSGYVALVSDMTERRAAEATVRFQATHDALTQLSNRTAFLSALKHALEDVQRTSGRLGVLFVDLDGFKQVNDKHGHALGDVLLATAARRLERCVRTSDLVARFGGDEFVVLLKDHTGRQAPRRVAQACIEALKAPFRIEGHELHVGASVGVACFPDHGASVDELIAAADRSMYAAKRAGGNQVHEDERRSPVMPRTSRRKPIARASRRKRRDEPRGRHRR